MSRWRPARVHQEHPTSGILLHVPRAADSTLPKKGTDVLVQIRQPRNIKHHRMYWAMVGAVVDATDRWPSSESLHRWIKWRLDMYRPVAVHDNLVILEWDATDFASMGQAEFKGFFDRAMTLIHDETGIEPESLRDVPF